MVVSGFFPPFSEKPCICFCLWAIVFVEFLLDKILLFDTLLCSFFILVTPNSLGVQVETLGDHPLLVFLFFYSLPKSWYNLLPSITIPLNPPKNKWLVDNRQQIMNIAPSWMLVNAYSGFRKNLWVLGMKSINLYFCSWKWIIGLCIAHIIIRFMLK